MKKLKLTAKLLGLLLFAVLLLGFAAPEAQAAAPEGYTSLNIESGSVNITTAGKYYIYGTNTATKNTVTVSGVKADVILYNVNINLKDDDTYGCAFQLKNGADVTLTLSGTNRLQSYCYAGLQVPGGTKVTIDGDGSLYASGNDNSAGIGAEGMFTSASEIGTVGTIIINGGTIKAYGYGGAAGIGGSDYGTTGSITINGGTVDAIGWTNLYNEGGAGIGGGIGGCVENITITGGTVNAASASGSMSAGIGSGYNNDNTGTLSLSCGNILITGGTVKAQSGGSNTAAIGYGSAWSGSGGCEGGSVTFQGTPQVTILTSNPNNTTLIPFISPAPSGYYYSSCSIYFRITDGRLENGTVTGNFVIKDGDTELANQDVTLTVSDGVATGTVTVNYKSTGKLDGLSRTLTLGGTTYSDTNVISYSFQQSSGYSRGTVVFEITDARLLSSGTGTFVVTLGDQELVRKSVDLTVSDGVATGSVSFGYDSNTVDSGTMVSRTLTLGSYTYSDSKLITSRFTAKTNYKRAAFYIQVTGSRFYGTEEPLSGEVRLMDQTNVIATQPVSLSRIDDNSFGGNVFFAYDPDVVDETVSYNRHFSAYDNYFSYYSQGKISDDFIADDGTRYLVFERHLEVPWIPNGYQSITLTLSQGNQSVSLVENSAYFSSGVLTKKLTVTPNLSGFSRTDPVTRTLSYEGTVFYSDSVSFDKINAKLNMSAPKGTVTLQLLSPAITGNLSVSAASINYAGHTPAANWYSIGSQIVDRGDGCGEITATLPLGKELTVSVTAPGINDGNAINYTFTPKDGETVIIWEGVDPPEPITAYYSQKLSDLTLPAGWAWDNPEQSVGDVKLNENKEYGYYEYPATYFRGQKANVQVTVKKSAVDVEVALVDAQGNPVTDYTYGDTIYLDITVTPNGKAPTIYSSLGMPKDFNELFDESYTLTVFSDVEDIASIPSTYCQGQYTAETASRFQICTTDPPANLSALNAGSHTLSVAVMPSGSTGMKFHNFDVTVNKATPTVTTAPTFGELTYGDSLSSCVLTGGEASVPGTFSWKAGDTVPTVADSEKTEYEILFTPTDPNYETAAHKITVKVHPREAKVTLTPNGGIYNGDITPASARLTNLVPGEDPQVTLTYTGTANDGSAYNSPLVPTKAGIYTVTASITDGNYILTGDTVKAFTVARAEVEVPVIGAKPYLGTKQTADISDTDVYTVTENEGGIAADSYNVVLELKDPDNYMWENSGEAEKELTFRITQAENAWSADGSPSNISWVYGAPKASTAKAKFGDVRVEYRLADAENGDDAYTENVPSDAGAYLVRFSVSETENYTGLAAVKNLEVTKANLTVTAQNKQIIYGDPAPAYSVDITGFVETENDSFLGGELTYDCDYEQYGDTGQYSITPKGYTSGNYEITFVSGKLHVEPKPITVSIDTKTSVYGEPIAALTGTTDGIVNNDANVYRLTTAATSAADVGAYDIEGEALDPNYSITFEDGEGAYIITKATAAVNVPPAVREGLVYDGTSQELISVANVEVTGGELMLSRDGVIFSDSIPTETNAGTYYVWYKAAGNDNHFDSEPVMLTVGIEKKDPGIGTVTASTVSDTLELSAIVLDREGKKISGTLSPDPEQTLELGDNSIAYTFQPTDDINYKTVTGTVTVAVVDTVAPTGTVSISTRHWTQFPDSITFQMFFKETQTVSVEAADNLSGVAAIEYFETNDVLELKDVEALHEENWTKAENGTVTLEAEDGKRFICYIRITDRSGNICYLATDGAEFDTVTPLISGVEAGVTYYTTQAVTVTDRNLLEITVNEAPSAHAFALAGNTSAEYTVTAADRAGNITAVTVKMAPISEITGYMDDKSVDNVTSDHVERLASIRDTLAALTDEEDATREEKQELEAGRTQAEAMLAAVEAALKALDTENVRKTGEITKENVAHKDKQALADAITDLEKALEEYDGNYTQTEKAAVAAELTRMEKALQALENAEKVQAEAASLVNYPDPFDMDTISAVLDSYQALTDHEKTLVDGKARDKLERLAKILEEYKQTHVVRYYGENRFETGIAVAEKLKEELGISRFDTVIVARGDRFVDALSAGYLSIQKNAPILLVTGEYMDSIKTYIRENLTEDGTVYILGGYAAVPATMEESLDGFTVKRLGGANRYETNLEILKEAGVSGSSIVLCSGKNYPDALAAAAMGKPVMLVHDDLSPAQLELLQTGAGSALIVGGTKAVSTEAENSARTVGSVTRLGGANRYETAVMLAKYAFGEAKTAILVSGSNYPDALCSAPLARMLDAPVLLADNGQGASAKEYLAQMGISSGCVLGGEKAVSRSAVAEIFE